MGILWLAFVINKMYGMNRMNSIFDVQWSEADLHLPSSLRVSSPADPKVQKIWPWPGAENLAKRGPF